MSECIKCYMAEQHPICDNGTENLGPYRIPPPPSPLPNLTLINHLHVPTWYQRILNNGHKKSGTRH